MFIHNIDPVLFSIGPLSVRYYGLVYAIGFLMSYWILLRMSKKGRIKMTESQVDSFIMWMIIGIIVGARVFEVLFWDHSYFSDPITILYIWRGGLAFHGGLVGAIIVGYFFTKKHKINFFELADIMVIPAALALALGRIANFINAELPGRIADVSWCVKFPYHEGCRHPSQLYESMKNFFIFALLLFLDRKKHKPGFLFWNFFLFYGVLRFITNIWRDDPSIILGMSMGQLQSMIMAVIAVVIIYIRHKEDVKRVFVG